MDRLTYWQGKGANALRQLPHVWSSSSVTRQVLGHGGDGACTRSLTVSKAWIKIQPFTQEIEGCSITRSGGWAQMGMAAASHCGNLRCMGRLVVARLEGFADRDAAAGLKAGCRGSRAAMPENREGEYYWTTFWNGSQPPECIQARFRRKDSRNGCHTVLVVQGEKEILVPFIQDVIVNVDLQTGR